MNTKLHKKKDKYLTEATIYKPCEFGITPALQGFFYWPKSVTNNGDKKCVIEF